MAGRGAISLGFALGGAPLADHPEVMRSAGGLQLDIANLLLIVKPVENVLVLLRRHHLRLGNVHPATHRNQQESVQGIGPEVANQVKHGGQLFGVVPRDRHIDLHRHADLFEIAKAVNGGIEGARNSAEGVMRFRIYAIQADRDALYPRVHDLAGDFFRHQGSVGGQRHP